MIADLAHWPGFPVLLPLLAALGASGLRNARIGAWLAVGASAAAFAFACALPWQMRDGTLLLVDPLAAHVALLTAFVGMTASWLDRERGPFLHALFLIMLGALMLGALASNPALAWLALEAATIAGAVAIVLPCREESAVAGWRFFVLAGVGLVLALFGVVLLYLAVLPVLGPGAAALRWTALADAAPQARGALLTLGFVFLLIGYGTHAALAPLHAWLPEVQSAAPAPVAALLIGAMPNVALIAILRTRALLAASTDALAPGPPLMALGLLSLLLGAFSLWRQHDAKRSFAFAIIGQSGVAAFAFGLGGIAATFAALLHLTLLTLVKVALPHGFDSVAPRRDLRTLTHAAGIAALAAMPPFGLFTSTFLILSETARRLPWLLPPLGIGLAVSVWALATRLSAILPTPKSAADAIPAPLATLAPAWLALALVLLLGLAMPGAAVAWFTDMARALQ